MLYTIGHSTHDFQRFAALLRQHDVTAIADVRSAPYSRFNPQYNRETLKAALEQSGIAYVHLGEQLGAMRRERESFAGDGSLDFGLTIHTATFREGVQRIRSGMQKYSIAMMCAEQDPLTCHRNLLVSRYLRDEVADLGHIRGDGQVESQESLESRLLDECGLPQRDLFRSRQELVAQAYAQLGRRPLREDESQPEA